MDLVQFTVVLIVVGCLLWAANNYIPMDPTVKKILNIAVIIATALWVLNVFGVFTTLHQVRVGP